MAWGEGRRRESSDEDGGLESEVLGRAEARTEVAAEPGNVVLRCYFRVSLLQWAMCTCSTSAKTCSELRLHGESTAWIRGSQS